MTEHHFLSPGLKIQIEGSDPGPPPAKDVRIRAYFFIDGRQLEVEPFGVYTVFNHKVAPSDTSVEPFIDIVRRAVVKRLNELNDTDAARETSS